MSCFNLDDKLKTKKIILSIEDDKQHDNTNAFIKSTSLIEVTSNTLVFLILVQHWILFSDLQDLVLEIIVMNIH